MFPAQANVYRVMLEMLDVLEAMIPEWDGKVVNKRFVTAFEKRFDANRGRLSISTDASIHPQFKFFVIEGRCVQTPKGCFYVEDYYRQLYYGTNPYINADNRRLKGTELAEVIKQQREYLEKEIANYEWCLEHYDEVRQQTRELDKQVREFYDRIPYPLRPQTYYIENPFEYFFH